VLLAAMPDRPPVHDSYHAFYGGMRRTVKTVIRGGGVWLKLRPFVRLFSSIATAPSPMKSAT